MSTQHEIQVEGRTFVVLKKSGPGPDPMVAAVVYSMDNGASWHPSVGDAFRVAGASGSLTEVSEPVTEGGELEAFVLALVEKLGELEPGETLKLVKTETQIVVLSESIVLAVRGSAVDDMKQELSKEGQ